jgi:hypothetical protein
MDEEIPELDPASPEMRKVREDWHLKNMEEIRATVIRGSTGIEASYLVDQAVRISRAGACND